MIVFVAPEPVAVTAEPTKFSVVAAVDSAEPSSCTVIPAPISSYEEPSFVNCHLSVVSFHLRTTFVPVPLSTSIPAFCDGVPVSSLLSVIILSPIFKVLLLTIVCVPDTVKLPLMTTFCPTFRFDANVTLSANLL